MYVNQCTPKDFDEEECQCDGCKALDVALTQIQTMFGGQYNSGTEMFLCAECIKELYSKINPLTILTLTGVDVR